MTQERIEELYKSGAITFQEALELSGGGAENNVEAPAINFEGTESKVKEEEKAPTKKEMFADFIENKLLEPYEEVENGERVFYDFMPIDEILDHLERNNIMWHGEKPTVEKIENEIKSLTKNALSRCIGYANEGYKAEDCHCWTEGTCFRVDAYFEGNDKNISVDVRFVPHQGFQTFDYEKYKLLSGEDIDYDIR
jgi:hypothetical protein